MQGRWCGVEGGFGEAVPRVYKTRMVEDSDGGGLGLKDSDVGGLGLKDSDDGGGGLGLKDSDGGGLGLKDSDRTRNRGRCCGAPRAWWWCKGLG